MRRGLTATGRIGGVGLIVWVIWYLPIRVQLGILGLCVLTLVVGGWWMDKRLSQRNPEIEAERNRVQWDREHLYRDSEIDEHLTDWEEIDRQVARQVEGGTP